MGNDGSGELNILSGLDAVRRLESRLFRTEKFSETELVGMLVQGALLCGVEGISVHSVGLWRVVAGNSDWLVEDDVDVSAEAFGRIVSYRAGGVNSMRPEVLAAAFATDVFTTAHDIRVVIKGDPEPFLDSHPDVESLGARVVGFRAAALD